MVYRRASARALNDDFDVSGGDESDFVEDGIYSYLPGESVDVLELEASQSKEANCCEEEQELDAEEDVLQRLRDEDSLGLARDKPAYCA